MTASQTWEWATVTQVTPLRVTPARPDAIQLDLTPDNLAGPLVLGQSVMVVRDGTRLIVVGSLGGTMLGEIKMWPSDSVPVGWVLCDGRALSRSVYAALFSVLGTTYGPGDGSATFNLPNFAGRLPVGPTTAYAPMNGLGRIGGSFTHTLTQNEMPSHTHVQNAHKHTHDQSGGGNLGYGGDGSVAGYTAGFTPNNSRLNTGIVTADATATNQNTGGGQAHANVQPFTTVNFIIRT